MGILRSVLLFNNELTQFVFMYKFISCGSLPWNSIIASSLSSKKFPLSLKLDGTGRSYAAISWSKASADESLYLKKKEPNWYYHWF